MSIYLETNALRKLTDYSCNDDVCTSIFSVFELLSGMNEKDFEVRKACIRRISEIQIEIRTPMIDQLLMDMFGVKDYNKFACAMIRDIFCAVVQAENFSQIEKLELGITNIAGTFERINALKWLKDWDNKIAEITRNTQSLFETENRQYISKLYRNGGIKALADYYWNLLFDNRLDENRLSHAEAFIGTNNVERIREETNNLFETYNFKLFFTAQAAIFAEAYFVNGNTQNANNASDLLHLLYLKEGDIYVSNDKIYQKIAEACPEFKLVVIKNEKSLSDLIDLK